MKKDKIVPIGLAKVAGRHRCTHPLRKFKGRQTGTLDTPWNNLLSDLTEFGEKLLRPRKRTAARR